VPRVDRVVPCMAKSREASLTFDRTYFATRTRFICSLFASYSSLPCSFSLLVRSPEYLHRHNRQRQSSLSPSPSIIMTSSSPTPDIASLSLSSQPTHPRLHDTYDYDGTGAGNVRPQYHFATAPHVPPVQPPFNPLSMNQSLNQSPLKNKTARAGLPSVRPIFFFSPCLSIFHIRYPHMHPFGSNGLMAGPLTPTIALCLPPTILTFRPAVVRPLSRKSVLPQAFRLSIKVPKTRLYPLLLSSKTSPLMSNARPFWTSSLPCPFQPRMHSTIT